MTCWGLLETQDTPYELDLVLDRRRVLLVSSETARNSLTPVPRRATEGQGASGWRPPIADEAPEGIGPSGGVSKLSVGAWVALPAHPSPGLAPFAGPSACGVPADLA